MNANKEYEPVETLRAFQKAADITERMSRLGITLADALELLDDLLRGFEEYERQQEAGEGIPLPAWIYGGISHHRPQTTYVMEEMSK